jgi:hypothetical protein
MKPLLIAAVAAMLVVALAPAALATPADGNGNKEVEQFEDLDIPIHCDDDGIADLSLDAVGFVQGKQFSGTNNRNLELTVFHVDLQFSNSSGETWVWRDRGPDHVYANGDGDIILTITGRSGLNNIGHVVLDLTPGDIELQAGMPAFGGELFEKDPADFACETLAG